MPRNGSGTYTFPSNSWNPAVDDTDISATDWNSTSADVATAISGSIAADGQTPITANIPMAGFKITGLGAPASSGDALAWGDNGNVANLTISGSLTYGSVTSSGVIGTGSVTLETDNNYTPSDQSGASLVLTNQEGHYRRVGNLVYVWGAVTYPPTVDTNQAALSLPITAANVGTQGQSPVNLITASRSGYTIGAIGKNTQKFIFVDQTGASVTNAAIGNGNVFFTGVYAVA